MLIIGHRGAPSLNDENTVDSFKSALSCNVDGIELDVQLTKDKQLVVFHDLHTHRLNGQHDLIADYNLSELHAFNSKIPVLEDVLKIMPPNIELHIEVKSESMNNKYILIRIDQLITQYQLKDQVVLSSFNPFVLSSIKKFITNIKVGLLWTKCPDEPWIVRMMSNKILTYYSYYKLKPYSFHANIQYINLEMVQWVKKNNMKLYYYTVNNKQDLERAKSFDADAIFSDYPNILK